MGLSFGSPDFYSYISNIKQNNHTMSYTLNTISTAPSYGALKRNGFTDIDVLSYYGTPISDRVAFFKQVKAKTQLFDKITLVAPIREPKKEVKKVVTQKCTEVDIDTVRDMALEHMEMDFTYRGRTFNMNKMGWTFAFNDKKRALGQCSSRRKTIYLSQWFIEHNTREMKMWINTMIHEIAHAINNELGGRGHDWQWRDIFVSFGGDGNRTSNDAEFTNLLEKPISKYTTICPNGHTHPSHKKSRAIAEGRRACTKCCNEHANGKFDSRFALKQIQNY